MMNRCFHFVFVALVLPMVALSAPEEKAPYSLTIINHGESAPRASNDTETGKQANRRVDISIARKAERSELEERSLNLDQGGTIWVTKDPSSLDRQLEIDANATAVVEGGKLASPFNFTLKTNYAAFIDRWEIHLYRAGSTADQEKYELIAGRSIGLSTPVEWNGATKNNLLFRHGLEIDYVLRVFDQSGNYDETHPRTLKFVLDETDGDRALASVALPELILDDDLDDNYDELAHRSIPLNGAKVRLNGADLLSGQSVFVNGEKVTIEDEAFVVEYLLPGGKHEFEVLVSGDGSKDLTRTLEVDLDTDYFFMVALADLTVGENEVSGSIEPLAVDEHHYGGDIFVDGRLAFYLKGKIKGKYLITAQMDTGTGDVEDLFDDLHKKDPESLFRRLDPDQYYPVYGDDSSVYDDTNSQGKIYIRAEWDKSRVLWGNYNTSFTGTELAPFNRSLYGAQVIHRSISNTIHGDSKTDITAFASEAQSAHRHNEFLGTGGSLYYLSDTDIVAGSEKVWVEVRQSGTDHVVEKVALVEGRDYEIDDFQGRLILIRPLLSVSAQSGPSIIKDEPQSGNSTWLIVDYEYVSSDFSADQITAGARGKRWLDDNVAVGATWAYEKRDGEDYDIKAVDVTVKKSDNTYVKGEFAHTESAQTGGSFTSTDGGLNFQAFNSNGASVSGDAISVEARVDLRDVTATERDISIGAWARSRDGGYSTTSSDTGVDTIDGGVEAIASVSEKLAVSARMTTVDRKNVSDESAASVQADYAATSKVKVTGEVRQLNEKNESANTSGKGTLAAAKIAVDISDKTNLYAIGQGTLSNSGSYTSNDLLTIGGSVESSERLTLNGELSTGDRGDNALFGAEWRLSETYSVYSNLTSSLSRNSSRQEGVTVGQRKALNSQLKIYTEHQFTRDSGHQGNSHTIGVDKTFSEHLSGNLSLQSATLDDGNGGTTDRDALSAGLSYQKERTRIASKFEYRLDTAENLDLRQWVVTNRFEYRHSPSLRWQGKLNASFSDDRLSGESDARFVEAGVGFALRPVSNDRLNMLGRLTYLYDLPPEDQSDTTDERSLIGSLESVYELTRYWSLGGKIAHRSSELRLFRDSGEWIGNDASLFAVTVARRMPFRLEALATYHWLKSADSQSLRHGALLTLGRRVSDHLKFSVGYNFTSFDDDLGSDSYKVKGWFVNLVGTY